MRHMFNVGSNADLDFALRHLMSMPGQSPHQDPSILAQRLAKRGAGDTLEWLLRKYNMPCDISITTNAAISGCVQTLEIVLTHDRMIWDSTFKIKILSHIAKFKHVTFHDVMHISKTLLNMAPDFLLIAICQAGRGDLYDRVLSLLHPHIVFNYMTLFWAVVGGSHDIMSALFAHPECSSVIDDAIIDALIRSGNVAIFRRVNWSVRGGLQIDHDRIICAIESKSLDMLKTIVIDPLLRSTLFINFADTFASVGDPQCLAWALAHHLNRDLCNGEAIANAIYIMCRNGNLACIDLVMSHFPDIQPTRGMCLLAAISSIPQCLDYILSKSSIRTSEIMCTVAEYGNYECMVVAHKHGVEWSPRVCDIAATVGAIDCLRYAVRNGCPLENTTLYAAIVNNRTLCANWIRLEMQTLKKKCVT